MMFFSMIFIAVDNVPFLSWRSVNIFGMNILMFFKLIVMNHDSSSRVDVGPEPPDGVILEALVWHVQVFVDDQVFVEALEDSTFRVDVRVNCIVFVVIIKLLTLGSLFSAVEVSKVDVVHACCSRRVSILRTDFKSKI